MTQNQIAYKNARELERHNQATEYETSRHQKVQEALSNWANALQNYQIAVNNAHYVRMDAETERANKARELENFRSNTTGEYLREQSNRIQSMSVAETSRHQKAMESLQNELNKSTQASNYARAEESYASAGLKEAQTTTEGYRPGQIVNEIDLTNSQANLNRTKLTTEQTQQFVNISQSVRNITGAAGDVFKVIGDLMSSGAAPKVETAAESFMRQFNQIKTAQ